MRKLLLKFFSLLCLIMMAQTGWGSDKYYTPSGDIWRGAMVKNSSGDDVRYLGASQYEKRIAVIGTFQGDNSEWVFRNTNSSGNSIDPEWYVRSKAQTLSIMNLFEGDEVDIIYYNIGNRTTTPTIKNTSYVTSTNPWEWNGSKGVYSKMTKAGSMDFTIPLYVQITSIRIRTASDNYRISFDTSGLGSNGNTSNYYRCQLSSRNFVEPAFSVYPSNAEVTFSVESFYTYNGTQIPVSTNYNANSDNLSDHEDHQVAVIETNSNDAENQDHTYSRLGDLLFKNIGFCKVTATANGQSATYWVEVWDNEACYEIVNNNTKFKFIPNPDPALGDASERGGILKNRVITGVGGVKMTIGNVVNNSVVVYADGDHMACFSNATNGWWDRWPYRVWWPTEGTYYQFEATAKGKLKFGGIKQETSDGGRVYIVNKSTLAQTTIFTNDQSGYLESGEIDMVPGQIYYLHGEAEVTDQGQKWSNFCLEWFSFETDLKLSESYGVSASTGYEINKNHETVTSRATITGEGNIGVIRKIFKGSVKGADVTISNGHIVFSNFTFDETEDGKMGGAIQVRLGEGSNYKDFTMTIPYGKHVWDFRNTTTNNNGIGENSTDGKQYTAQQLVNDMKANTDDLSRVYKVHRRDNGAWIELKTPILAARGAVAGNNAFYMTNTNGLVIDANAECFGSAEDESMNSTSNYSSLTDDQKYYLPPSSVVGSDHMWLHTSFADNQANTKYSKILFPGVKANQYIKIYCHRHSDGKGETYTTENLMDLSGKTINSNFIITGNQGDDKRLRGVIIFRVPADYEPTDNLSEIPALILKDDGWTRYLQIEITDEYSTDLRSYITEQIEDGVTKNEQVGAGLPCNSKGSVVYKNSASVKLEGYNNTYIQNAWSPQFTVDMPAGSNVTYTLAYEKGSSNNNGRYNYWRNLIINITGGSGNLHVIQEMVTGEDGYVLDRSEFWLAVSQYHPQTYPYTWDFTARNMSNPWTVEGFNRASTADNTTPYARMSTTDGAQAYGRWDDGTNTNKIVHFVGQDYYNEYTSHRNINNRNNNADSFEDVEVSDADLFNYGSTENEVSAQVIRPLVADGGELTYGSTTLKETIGLRFGLPRIGVDWFVKPEDFAEGGKYEEYNNTLEFTENGMVITAPENTYDFNRNHNATTIYIPEIDPGMYIFVKATAKPTVSNATEVDKYAPANGVYVFKKTAAKDVEVGLKFSSATVYKIGVTNIEKSINDIGYATESRDHAIDHTYTGEFTLNDVNAYGITIYGDNESPYNYKGYSEVHKSENEVTVIPAYTGVVLYKDETSAVATFPLFYPACNVVPSNADNEILKTNWMAPNVVSTTHSEETEIASAQNGLTGWNAEGIDCTKFVMTRYHFVYKKDSEGEGIDTEQGKVFEHDVEAFYRLRIDPDASKNVLGANKAYLLVPTASLEDPLWNGGTGGYVNMFYIDLADVEGFGDVEPTSIDSVQDVTYENNVYYTLTGIRLNGKPTVKGFYLCNGKKVYVK